MGFAAVKTILRTAVLYFQNMTLSERKKILLAEDDSSMRRFVEIILQQAGFEVVTAEDGLQAMQIALENNLDAVVADAIMPHLSGYDLCRMLRGNDEKRNVPLVILSGLAQENPDKPDCLADAYLFKDANLKENLISTLEKLI
ncbi:MAG: CheA signal transduction histidine kinase [Acidobacteria bacterium]|jgi:DNA-binding response OmpR family regulator|nr:CheA signal transduction histidine kinase [Acidobacteriota bacterium]